MSKLWSGLWVCGLLWWGLAPAQATSSRTCKKLQRQQQWLAASKCLYRLCRALYQLQNYPAAGRCFLRRHRKVRKMGAFSLKKHYQGVFLWGAIQAFRRGAAQAPKTKAAWMRERALRLLKQYTQQKHPSNPERRMACLRLERQLLRQIGYATLKVETQHHKATSCLSGAFFRTCVDGKSWQLQMRPGGYSLLIRYPGQPPVFRKTRLWLASSEKKSLVFVPPRTSALASLVVRTKPAGVHVYIDSVHRGTTPLRLKLYVGTRQLELKKRCYGLESRAVVVRKGQANRFAASLRPEPIYQEWLRKRAALRGQQILGWSLLAGGAALALLGSLSHVFATRQLDGAIGNLAPVTYSAQVQEGNTLRTLGFVGLGVGVALGGSGATRLLTLRQTPFASLPCRIKSPRSTP